MFYLKNILLHMCVITVFTENKVKNKNTHHNIYFKRTFEEMDIFLPILKMLKPM
jgi:hypothetical protein